MLPRVAAYLDQQGVLPFRCVADQGCGKLRNLDAIATFARTLYLVDTSDQLASGSVRHGRHVSLARIAAAWSRANDVRSVLMPSARFTLSRLGLDAVLSVCVVDVVPGPLRREILRAARRNLRRGGYYVVIAMRNHTSITSRCSPANAYEDGHIFEHHGSLTFYRNFDTSAPLVRSLTSAGFELEADLSVYRYVALVLRAAS